MASLVLDSSVWIALYLSDDPQHRKAVQLFDRHRGPIYLPDCVVSEVATVLTYKDSKALADRFIDFILDDELIIWVDANRQQDIADFRAVNQRISFADATLLGIAQRLDIELVTYDQQLARLASRSTKK